MTRPGLSLPNVAVYLQCSFPLLQNDLKHASAERHKLEKHVAVELRAEMKQTMAEKEKLADKNKHLGEDIRRLQEQIERILRRPEA